MLTPERRSQLVDEVTGVLGDLLGPGWDVQRLATQPDDLMAADAGVDAQLEIGPPDQGRRAVLLVAARPELSPRVVKNEIAQIAAVLKYARSYQQVLVVAPWISPSARQELARRDVSYLDLSGNASIRIDVPSVRIETRGASRDPGKSESTRTVTLAGPRAGRLIRAMVDFETPYRASELADLSGVSLPWISRLLGQLEDQLLVTRDGRMVTEVRWADLLRARARSYDLLRHNSHVGFVAPNGIQAALDRVRDVDQKTAITGSCAARTVAPLTSGGQLMIYVDAEEVRAPDLLAETLGLLRVDEAADVVVLRAHDDVVFERTKEVDGIRRVALSQLVLDGLAGPGRMPAEAEAVLAAMTTDTRWRERVPKAA